MNIPCTADVFTKEKVEALAQKLGLDLPHQEQWDFLQSLMSLDLQAAPGSGKTSLIGLKLGLLAQGWTSPTRGICVLSHTNTAKDEILARLDAVPAGSRLLQYPHFIGTIQSFVDTFLALPALRSWGVETQHIDDDIYETAALRLLERNPRYRKLSAYLDRRRDGLRLVAEARYVCEAGKLKPTGPNGTLPFGPDSPSGLQFAQLKKQLTRQGILRYHDMFAIAQYHLHHHPNLAQATARRFLFVLLDEMQDTSALQQSLLTQVFAFAATVVQRVGDVNQRIFDDSQDNANQPHAFPRPHAAELPVSRRFGSAIATLASELTVHRPQQIHGAGPEATIALLLFDDSSVAEVVPAFERIAAATVPRELLLASPPRVLGSRLTPGTATAFPQSLACYVPDNAGNARRQGTAELITTVRAARTLKMAGDDHAASQQVWNGIREVFRLSSDTPLPPLGRLERTPGSAGGQTRLLLHEMLTVPLDDEAAWSALLGPMPMLITELVATSLRSNPQIKERLAYMPEESSSVALASESPERVSSVAGSIQSAKGETHTATLIIECLDRTGKKHDVHEVLQLLARKADPTRAGTSVRRAIQMVFVGATRPTHLLALAAHRQRAEPYIEAVTSRGWKVVDVSTPW